MADLGSVRAAASALNLTPSAITHRVKALEADVGLDLFERRGREISISPDGTRYREKILGHVNAIREATDNLAKRERVDRIRIASIDLFHSNWLMPRIDRFLEQFPNVAIDFLSLGSRHSADADITIRPAWRPGGAKEVQLFGWEVTPFCRKDFARRHNLRTPEDLRRVPLIDTTSPLKVWKRWFGVAGILFAPGEKQIHVDRFENALTAAANGLGVIISTPRFVMDVSPEMVAPFDCYYRFTGGMFVSVANNGNSDLGRYFSQWLFHEANS